jgi:hypothetical protein
MIAIFTTRAPSWQLAAARQAVDAAAAETGLPAADPVRDGDHGTDRLAAAVLG